MARPIAQFTLDGPTGRFDRQTGIVRFEPAARRRFAADDDLRTQIAAMKRQIQAATRRAEVAETQLSRLRQSAPATTPADAFAIIAAKVYAQRRQMSAPETAPEPFGMSAESVYAARRKAAQRLL